MPEFADGLSCSPAYANKEIAEKETYQLAVHWHFIVVQCSDEIVRCETILRKHGLAVKCVLHSKRVALFEGQKGAAFYRTNRGNFDALFLPKAETFHVQPNETRKDGWYIYSFRGSPRPTGGLWNCARPTYFTQHANQLFVTQNEQLITGLDRALASIQTNGKSW